MCARILVRNSNAIHKCTGTCTCIHIITMKQRINCNFAKTAVRLLIKEFKCTGQYLNGKALQSVTAAYNKWFESYGQMQTTQVVASF